MAAHDHDFHIPSNNIWPPISCAGAGLIAFGFVFLMHAEAFGVPELLGKFMMGGGLLVLLFGALQWFRLLIGESRDRGFENVPGVLNLANKYGMIFFICSEVMFFAAFFAAFFFLRNYQFEWPPANITELALTIPVLNTLLLLSSGATITWAHYALMGGEMKTAKNMTLATTLLGFIFLGFQMFEYGHALFDFDSGVYGSLFYMLTGFHGFHVLVGSLMLAVLYKRLSAGDFNEKNHFYFEAAAWYWHFVDVVWVGLFISVYLL